ncbi:MAG: sulfatase-like hydrolase/transferase [Pseudomonadota bacterium]
MISLSSALLSLTALVLWKGRLEKLFSRVLAALLILLNSLLLGFYLFSNYFSGEGINEAVLYHLQTDLLAGGLEDFRSQIFLILGYVVATGALGILAFRWSSSEHDPLFDVSYLHGAVGYLLAGMALSLNPAIHDLKALSSMPSAEAGRSFPREYVEVTSLPPSKVLDTKRNLVHLYLESVERTYFDEESFPSLLPNLKALEQEAVSFTEIHQVMGTGYTLAGISAMQCGTPLFVGRNSMSGVDELIPGATCIGDLLRQEGYYLSYLGGASLDFAGKGKFLRGHGFQRVRGRKALLKNQEDEAYQSSWGIYDDALLENAKREFDELVDQQQPFGLFLLTLDTHHPKGHIPRSCEGLIYGDGKNPILNALHCTDHLVGDFVSYLRRSNAWANTLLVVSSDHLAMPNTASDTLRSLQRRNLLMFLGPDLKSESLARSGSTLDVAPTLLRLLGYPINSFAFGRDLLGGATPLFRDLDQFNELLHQSRWMFEALWQFPQLTAGVEVDIQANRVRLGDRFVKYPALFLLDEDLAVERIRFPFDSPSSLRKQAMLLPPSQRILWIDDCSENAAFALDSTQVKKGLCMALGTTAGTANEVHQLSNGETIPFAALRQAPALSDGL